MSRAHKGAAWARDLFQTLVLDRFHPARSRDAKSATTACRAARFHSRARIRQAELATLLAALGADKPGPVLLPPPSVDLGNVGSMGGYFVLGALVQALQPRVILEFGTYLGVSALAMMLNAPPGCHLHTVDLPDSAEAGNQHSLDPLDKSHVAGSRRRVGEAFLGRPEAARITQIRADSMTFRAEQSVPVADLVYVDGGHSLDLVARDTENAFRVLAPGGTILWDDYFHLYPDVVKYLDDLAQQHDLRGIRHSNYVIYSRRPGTRAAASRP